MPEVCPLVQTAQPPTSRGSYFAKKEYRDSPLPDWITASQRLPEPLIFEGVPLRDAYWKAWELAFAHFRRPPLGSPLVSNYLDPLADGRLLLADVATAVQFLKLAHPLVPGVRALDNFYARQHEDGEICRDIDPETGRDYDAWVNHERQPLFSRQDQRTPDLGREAPVPDLTLDGVGHPLLAWAELESYRQTGDADRLALVWEPLLHYYRALQTHLRDHRGLYVTDWAAMDNSPRNAHLGAGVDISCQMVLLARQLADIARVVAALADDEGDGTKALAVRGEGLRLLGEAEDLALRIREAMWDPATGFFYDLRPDGTRSGVRTVAAFWSLLAGVATQEQAERLAAALRDPRAFGTEHPVPSLAADDPRFDPDGGYYRGAVWPMMVAMVAKGLTRYGLRELARDVAMGHVRAVAAAFAETGTIWENYAPQGQRPGKPARPDFVGAAGVGPIGLLVEYGIGLRAHAPLRQLEWDVQGLEYRGCERYWFAGTTVDLLAAGRQDPDDPVEIQIKTDRPFHLLVRVADRTRRFTVSGSMTVTA
jgi:hypothetical protein